MISREIIKNGAGILNIWGDLKSTHYKISTDSRKYKNKELFLALQGENFDGFTYVEEVLKKGCEIVVFNTSKENLIKRREFSKKYDICFIEVEDSTKYFQNIALLHIQNWKKQDPDRNIIGITGSNGKTTTKEMLFHFLNSIMPDKIHCSWGNYNNHIGVPATIVEITDQHQAAIIEMGTNHPGEIELLCNIALPNAGIITSIGKAHLEFFNNEENIFKEKSSLFEHVGKYHPSAPFVVDGEDIFLKTLSSTKGLVKYSCDSISLSSHQVVIDGSTLENRHITGKHNFKNLSCSF
ncbi:MAG: UDP-N-acetylmuramoyl-tripeptide--D-alanyl-D-alanine ligase, partial [Halobacteriovoraceae bacterium]|nr:UDP-N-acetylmuramoyl-tripeptide--D-alanyl-D-alanine ligase [Halobacteriovoraceae bacterium]